MKRIFRKFMLSTLIVAAMGWSVSTLAAKTDIVRPLTPLMKKRADEFKKITKRCSRRLIRLSWDSTMHMWRDNPDELAVRLQLLGFTDAIVELEAETFYPDESYQKTCHNLLNALTRRKIRSWALITNYDLFAIKKGGWFSSDKKMLNVRLEALTDFNKTGKAGAKFTGALLEAKPHLMTGILRYTPQNMLYQWHPGSYGKGLDNDILMTRMFDTIAGTNEEETLPFGFITSPEYTEKHKAKQLSKGHVKDFLKHGNFVVLESFSSKHSTIFRLGAGELRSAAKPKSVILGIYTDEQTANSGARKYGLNIKGWKYFARGLTKLVKSAAKYKTFGGLYFDDFDGFELIWDTNK
jgi:hypothetical protein